VFQRQQPLQSPHPSLCVSRCPLLRRL
jgi:hypothetical protein